MEMKTLIKFAKEDLALARKHGRVSIVDTKLGCINVEYRDRLYCLTAVADMRTQDLGSLPFKEAADLIALLYVVEKESA